MFHPFPTTNSTVFGLGAQSASKQNPFGLGSQSANSTSPFGGLGASSASPFGGLGGGQSTSSSSPFGGLGGGQSASSTSPFGGLGGVQPASPSSPFGGLGGVQPASPSSPFGGLGGQSTSPFGGLGGGQSAFVANTNLISNPNNPFAAAVSSSTAQTSSSMTRDSRTVIEPGICSSSSSPPVFGQTTGGSNPFGKLTNSNPFGTQSVFGQTTGGTNPFGQLTNSQPFGTQSVFGQPSSNSSYNNFGGPALNPFATTPTTGGGIMFSGNSTGAFGVRASPFTFGTSTSSSSATSTFSSAFQTPAFSSTGQSSFKTSGVVVASDRSTSVFPGIQHGGSSSSQLFGSTSLAFSSNGAFGSTTTPIFGNPSNFNPVAPINHELQNSRFIFGQPNSQFGKPHSPFGGNSGPAARETQNFYSASHPTTTTLHSGQSGFDGQRSGSKIASYMSTREEVDKNSMELAGKILSISAMPIYKDKSHEELRFEDSHQSSGNKPSGFNFQFNEPFGRKTGCIGPSVVAPGSQPQPLSVISPESGPWMSNSSIFPPFGSNVATTEMDTGSPEIVGNFLSISAMPIYSDRSHEELRFQDSNRFKVAGSGFFSPLTSDKTNPSLVPNTVTPHIQPQESSALPTGTGPFNNTSNSFLWPKPIIAPLMTQTVVAPNPAFPSISQRPFADAVDTGTRHQSAGMQQSECNGTMALNSSVVASPFGMESRRQMSEGGLASTTTVQYGISCIPVSDKTEPVKRNSLLTTRCLSLIRRNRPSVEKQQPKIDSQKVLFYEDKLPGIYKVGASFIPRENARSWVNPSVKRPLKTDSGNLQVDLEAMLPKLQNPEYYMKPPVQELAAKERAEPGFCQHVRDFVVGREGYGSIRFLGETDVRNLDVESVIQFNHREVIVYGSDTSEKPPVGEGLNKSAEVTLLYVKCIDKRTREQYLDGERVDKWINMLKMKAEEQDAEFLSYHPATGEWKFRVQHF